MVSLSRPLVGLTPANGATGNRYINQLSRALMIPESAMKAAGQVFKLAVGLNFIQGRRTKTVAAVALYIACRRQDGNTVMLIDFADVLMVSTPRTTPAPPLKTSCSLPSRSTYLN